MTNEGSRKCNGNSHTRAVSWRLRSHERRLQLLSNVRITRICKRSITRGWCSTSFGLFSQACTPAVQVKCIDRARRGK